MTTSGRVRVCICADDFGQHEGINEAVLRLAALGRVHAVGSLVGSPSWKPGVGALRQLHAEGLDTGLHLDLTAFPLSCRPLPLGALVARGLLRALDRAGIRKEIRIQLDAFETALGHGPAFVDGHQHVHQLPGVRDELLMELDDRYGGHPPWIRGTRAVPVGGPTAPPRLKASIIGHLGGRGLEAVARDLGFAQNRGLLGVYDFRGGAARYMNLLRAWLAAARDGDLLMCHPALGVVSGDPLGAARRAEFDVLSSSAADSLLRDGAVSLQPMSQILLHYL